MKWVKERQKRQRKVKREEREIKRKERKRPTDLGKERANQKRKGKVRER